MAVVSQGATPGSLFVPSPSMGIASPLMVMPADLPMPLPVPALPGTGGRPPAGMGIPLDGPMIAVEGVQPPGGSRMAAARGIAGIDGPTQESPPKRGRTEPGSLPASTPRQPIGDAPRTTATIEMAIRRQGVQGQVPDEFGWARREAVRGLLMQYEESIKRLEGDLERSNQTVQLYAACARREKEQQTYVLTQARQMATEMAEQRTTWEEAERFARATL